MAILVDVYFKESIEDETLDGDTPVSKLQKYNM